jgi:hypothetical protein
MVQSKNPRILLLPLPVLLAVIPQRSEGICFYSHLKTAVILSEAIHSPIVNGAVEESPHLLLLLLLPLSVFLVVIPQRSEGICCSLPHPTQSSLSEAAPIPHRPH